MGGLQIVLMPGMLWHTDLVGGLPLKPSGFLPCRSGFCLSLASWKRISGFSVSNVNLFGVSQFSSSEIPTLQAVQTRAPALSSEQLQFREMSCSTFSSWCRNCCPDIASKIHHDCGSLTCLCTNETRKRGRVRKSVSFLFLKALCKAAAILKKQNGLLHIYFCPKQILVKNTSSIAQQFLPYWGIIVDHVDMFM